MYLDLNRVLILHHQIWSDKCRSSFCLPDLITLFFVSQMTYHDNGIKQNFHELIPFRLLMLELKSKPKGVRIILTANFLTGKCLTSKFPWTYQLVFGNDVGFLYQHLIECNGILNTQDQNWCKRHDDSLHQKYPFPFGRSWTEPANSVSDLVVSSGHRFNAGFGRRFHVHPDFSSLSKSHLEAEHDEEKRPVFLYRSQNGMTIGINRKKNKVSCFVLYIFFNQLKKMGRNIYIYVSKKRAHNFFMF